MSWAPEVCGSCHVPCTFERYGGFDAPNMIAVSWACPQCHKRILDLVPLHTELPTPGMCLNCGHSLDGATSCASGCGVERQPIVDEIERELGLPPKLEEATRLYQGGLIRLFANAIDLRLEIVPDDAHAWLARARLLAEPDVWLRRGIAREPHRLAIRIALQWLLSARDDHEGALEVLDGALELHSGVELARLQHMRADLLCRLERGDEALAAIDVALLDDAANPSRHYVRGWALGLLGRLQEARVAMLRVLELVPDSEPAMRSLAKIDAALASE